MTTDLVVDTDDLHLLLVAIHNQIEDQEDFVIHLVRTKDPEWEFAHQMLNDYKVIKVRLQKKLEDSKI